MGGSMMKSGDGLATTNTSILKAKGRSNWFLAKASALPLLQLLIIAIQLSSSVQPAATYCDRTFSASEEILDSSGVRTFVAPSNLKAKQYAIYKNRQGNVVASRNLSSVGEARELQTNSSAFRTTGRAFHCLYKFVAREDERVAVSFTSSRLRGDEPECNREYVDIYARFKSSDQFNATIPGELPNGRFCTTIVPHKVISLNNMIVLSIYSSLEPPADGRPLFAGRYEFVKANVNEQNLGPPDKGTLCEHTIYSSSKREGEFQSITYPGAYMKDLRCSYKFIGEPNQRIRIEFLDLDLYSGGSHCPFDSVKIFDGLEEKDTIIQTICGSHRSLIIYSTKENLLITFTTLQREGEVQNRGFSAYFEFSDKFYDPNFIQGPNARHVRGSECDQRIVSTKASSGSIVSPMSKHDHSNAICRYFFEGLQSSHDYEKVLLRFTEFDLKTVHLVSDGNQQVMTPAITTVTPPMSSVSSAVSATPPLLPSLAQLTGVSGGDPNLASTNGSSSDQCPDNYVRVYTSEQKPDQKQDPNDYDYVFCGNEVPSTIESDAASMLMEYNSGSIGGHFKAEYIFIDDYRIPGYQLSTSCNYFYRSDMLKAGTFNSPRYPSWYINDMNCTYTFLTKSDEALLLQFPSFKMDYSFNPKLIGYNEVCRGEDSVEINEVTLDAGEQRVIDRFEIGTYCGTSTPGPILSFRPVQIHFRTNNERVHYGFVATYHFYSVSELRTNEFVSSCGEQIYTSHRLRSGSFSSPPTYRPDTYEKRNHICSWNITARPSYRIALDFTRFELEGNPPVRGCITASVRLELDKSRLPTELCGTLPAANGTGHQYVSESEWLVVTFISTKQASGSGGFTANWTEIKRTS